MSEKALIGVAGVHYVAGELSRRGWIALVTTRNTRGIDVLATKESKQVEIQVKTRLKSQRWLLGKASENFFDGNIFYIFVNLLEENERAEHFVVPSKIVAGYVTRTHRLFLKGGGKDTKMRQFPNSYEKVDLKQYKDKWDLLEHSAIT